MLGLGNRVKTSQEPNKVNGYNMIKDTRFLRDIGTGDTDFDNLTGYTYLIFLEDIGGRSNTASNTHFPTPLSIGTGNVGFTTEFSWYTGSDTATMRKYDGSGATTNNLNVSTGGSYGNTWAKHHSTDDRYTGGSPSRFAVAQVYSNTTDEADEYQDFYFTSEGVWRRSEDIDVDSTGDVSVSGSEIRICDGVNLMWDLDYISKGLKVNKIMFWKSKISDAMLYRLCGYSSPSSYSASGVSASMGSDCFRNASRFWRDSSVKYAAASVTQPDHEWDFTRLPNQFSSSWTLEDTGATGGKDLTSTGTTPIIRFNDPANGEDVGTR